MEFGEAEVLRNAKGVPAPGTYSAHELTRTPKRHA